MNKILIIFFIFLLPVLVYAQTEDQLFVEANRLYRAESFETALDAYLNIISSGHVTGELYYNIGNTYYKLGEFGKAVLFYERAKLLIPEDDDLMNNFNLISLSLADKITPIPEVFYVKYWNDFRKSIPLEAWKTIFFVVLWFGSGIICFMFFNKTRIVRKFLRYNLMALGFVFLISSTVLISNAVMDNTGKGAVVMQAEAKAFASPTETGTEVFSLHEGTRVQIKRESGDWIEVRLLDGKVGWILKDVVERI